MIVAYLTTEHEALSKLFNDSDPSKFIAADPFWFLLTAIVILALGPGWFSIDALLKRFVFNRPCVNSKSASPILMKEPAHA
jgi:putative oxidoreductase